jgi:hypothetical protein
MLHLSDSEKMSSACAAGEPAIAKIEKIIDYLPPEPLAGKDSFNIYPAKNIRNPEPGKQKAHQSCTNMEACGGIWQVNRS